ncbi:hypothetical protein E2L06_18385 [Haloterrigena sp. H1]|uniref:hypothetical protein n=1 Tax=Haloterrigena sp. H1 TaxID=2552943 RepID=UPI00110D5F18|nr:hypothetical protein [Haloterrigena sp. H1]TMT80227.1 hypothetical protein E2L06_18385 [Haloterrigena sp. H1]
MSYFTDVLRDFAYLYVLAVLAWAVALSGWTMTQGGSVTVALFADQWFMFLLIAVVMLVPTFAYRWSKSNLP